MKLIVAGGRDFNDYDLLDREAMRCFIEQPFLDTVVSGTAKGADALGEEFAYSRGFSLEKHPAEWDRFGKRAGYIRNEKMAMAADSLLAFWDGKSKGTKHMIDIALREGLTVRVVRY